MPPSTRRSVDFQVCLIAGFQPARRTAKTRKFEKVTLALAHLLVFVGFLYSIARFRASCCYKNHSPFFEAPFIDFGVEKPAFATRLTFPAHFHLKLQ